MRMRATLQLASLSAITIWQAASDPRCQVKGYFQSTPFIFSCDGSGGDRDSNKAQVQLASLKDQEILRIPKDTLDFVLSVESESSGDIVVVDPETSTNIVPHMLHNIGNNEWLGSYKGMDIRYVASTGAPTRERLSFSGAGTPELSLRLKNHASSSSDFTLGYYYFPYSGGGSQCKQGGAPIGCATFNQPETQRAVVDWVRWLRTRYNDYESAWGQVMNPLSLGVAVPFHRWCPAWTAWSGSSSVSCDAAFKFLTGGGLEAHHDHVFKEDFIKAWSLPDVATFDDQCCGQLRSSFSDAEAAWASVGQVQRQYNLASPIDGLLKVCKIAGVTPQGKDYVGFLDVDGDHPVGGITSSDLAHCWSQPHTPSPTPSVAATASPLPSSTTMGVAAGSPSPAVPTPVPAVKAAAPTPAPTPAPKKKDIKTPAPTPEPTPEPTSAPTPPPPPPRPKASMAVPTVFHYNQSDNKRCEGEPYTHNPAIGCDGWAGVTAQFCQEKCEDSEKAKNCPRRPCMAAVFFISTGWCHLYTADQCMALYDQQAATTYKKVAGGGAPRVPPPSVVAPVAADTGVAKPAIVPGTKLQQKHVPFLVGGAVGGVAAGAVVMAGIGTLISSISLGKEDSHVPHAVQKMLHRKKGDMTTVTTTATTTTTTTTVAWYEAMSNGRSEGPMLPLICLAFVCLCGLTALIIAAILDPCQRGPRKKVTRGVDTEVGGSVASVGSMASTEQSEEAYYYDSNSDGYGNSVVSLPGAIGGSVYTNASTAGESYEYGYLPQDAQNVQQFNAYGFPTKVPLSVVPEASIQGSSFASANFS